MLGKGMICAVIPTRGDVPMGELVDHLLRYPEVGAVRLAIGDTPYNRYLTMMSDEQFGVYYTQDDDCITDIRPILEAYDPQLVTVAMTPEHAAQYPGRQTLIGFGALFHREQLTKVFDRWDWDEDSLFLRESDRVFGTVCAHQTVFPEIRILPHAHNPNRLWKQPDHQHARAAMERRIFQVTGIRA